jgi:hypothetical protein
MESNTISKVRDAARDHAAGPPSYRPLPTPSELALTGAPYPDTPPAFAVRLVLSLRRLFLRIADLISPPEIVLFEQSTGVAYTALLGAVARHGVADFLALHGSASAEELARGLGLNADALHRTLRALSNMGIFAMSDAGVFSNNRVSRALCSGLLSRGREWALYFSSGSNTAAWLDCARTLETGESAFTRLHGMNVWDWFEAHADEREIFAHCMMGMTLIDAPVVARLYPFAGVKRVCDVGGGRGTLLSELVLRHPHLSGVLYDSPGVVESARVLLEQRGLTNRIELVTGSFFESVPRGSDAYLMKNILHDWNDVTCKRLLTVVRKAMEPKARLILCEMVVDKNSRNLMGTRADLQMMIACHNGRERSLRELQLLLEATGFRYRRLFPFPTLSVIEAEAV